MNKKNRIQLYLTDEARAVLDNAYVHYLRNGIKKPYCVIIEEAIMKQLKELNVGVVDAKEKGGST